MYPKSFDYLVSYFKQLPGVGAKTAERYALAMLEKDQQTLLDFGDLLMNIKQLIHYCAICNNMCEDDICEICKDQSRDSSVICVVQSAKDVMAMEKTHGYKGRYHVLNGLISANKGILPKDIEIDSLLQRINSDIEEVVIATNPTVDGETTALYIDMLLKEKGVLVTRLAHGLPMGGHLDYADELTLIKAIEGRKKI